MRALPILTICFVISFIAFVGLYFYNRMNSNVVVGADIRARVYVWTKRLVVFFLIASMAALYLDVYTAFDNLILR